MFSSQWAQVLGLAGPRPPSSLCPCLSGAFYYQTREGPFGSGETGHKPGLPSLYAADKTPVSPGVIPLLSEILTPPQPRPPSFHLNLAQVERALFARPKYQMVVFRLFEGRARLADKRCEV